MNMLNSVILEGRVSEIAKFIDGIEVVVESDRNVRNSEGVVEIVSEKFTGKAFGNLMKFIDERVKIGKVIRIVGRLSERIWKDLEGENHSTTVIIIEHLEVKNCEK